MEPKDWRERFDKQFPYKIATAAKHEKLLFINRELKDFIASEIHLAKQEVLRDLYNIAQNNDGGDGILKVYSDEIEKYAQSKGINLTKE